MPYQAQQNQGQCSGCSYRDYLENVQYLGLWSRVHKCPLLLDYETELNYFVFLKLAQFKRKCNTMVKKIPINEATGDTRLNDVHGFGSQSFTVLGVSGYKLKPTSTVSDFHRETKSYNALKTQLLENEINAKYVLPKFQAIWNGVGLKRKREEEPVPPPPQPVTAMDVRSDPEKNFLLTPQPIPGAPVTNSNPESVTSVEETPGVAAMDRANNSTPAIETGDIAAKVQVSVIPDQTLVVSGDDKSINAPTVMYPDTPVPTLPGISIGPSVSAVRTVAPLDHTEALLERIGDDEPQQFKANSEKDIGGDGFGQTPVQADETELGIESIGNFTTVPVLGQANTPTFDESTPLKPKDMRSASMHPFKQVSLFRDHDIAVGTSRLIELANYNTQQIFAASLGAVQNRDESWERYNQATQGVAMVDMPLESSNFLQRGEMTSEYQLLGANPLQASYSPAPFVANQLLGRFR